MKAFENYHPLALFCYFFAVLSVCMFAANPILIIIALAGALFFGAILLKLVRFQNLRFYVLIFMAITITNPVFVHRGRTQLFSIGPVRVTLESLAYGAYTGLMLISVMLWFKAYSEIMTGEKLMHLFGKRFPKLALMVSMIIRFIPLFTRQMNKIRHAQKTMGMFSGERYKSKVKGTARTLSASVSWALEHAADTSASMRARGYGTKGRTSFSLLKFQKKDAFMIFWTAFFYALVIGLYVFTQAEFLFYPVLRGFNITPLSAGMYVAWGVLCFIPVIIELKEHMKWHLFLSRI